MHGAKVLTFSAMAFMAASVDAAPQGENLSQELHNTYVETIMDANGLKVAKAGSTLVVQVDGVMANPNKKGAFPYPNTFSDGVVKPDPIGRFKNPLGGLPGRSAERAFTVGEKVYLLKTELNPDSIAFTVQSCGDCDPKSMDPAHQPFRAKVTFKFLRGALGSTDLKHVQRTIDQVFKFPDAAAPDTGAAPADTGAAPGQQATQAPPQPAARPVTEPPQKFDAIAPPPPPPAEPRKIALGMTIDEVKAGYGEPVQIVDMPTKLIYVYKNLKVTFVKGKVSDVE